MLFTLACGREPGIIVNIAEWPDGVERIRVKTTIEGTVGEDIFLAKDQTRFAVRVPASSQGTVHLVAEGLDATDCKLVRGMLDEPVPDNLSRFIERTLELSLLPTRACIFDDGHYFPVGLSPISVAVEDFNGDTKPDLVVANYMSNSVSVLLSKGQGDFSIATPFSVGAGPFLVAVGDFNGDTKPDLAVANYAENNVSVLLENTLGGFSPVTGSPFSVGPGANPSFVAVGDFNGDTKPDLAVVNLSSSTIGVLLGEGAGGFGPASFFSVGQNFHPIALAVGDFNGDMKLDLATANYGRTDVSVLPGDGMGGFDIRLASKFQVGLKPVSVVVGDFNGDMKPDLAVANEGSDTVSVLLGGNFLASTPFAVGKSPYAVTTGDFNGDMKLDLAVANTKSDDVSVLLGNGMGGFGKATNFPVGMAPTSVTVGNFNADKKPDLAVANASSNNVSILLNQF